MEFGNLGDSPNGPQFLCGGSGKEKWSTFERVTLVLG